MKTYGIGIVGAGWIADFYYKALQKTEDFTLIGACGNPSEAGRKRLEDKCRSWNTRAFASYEEMLADASVDVVAILSPTNLHFDQAMAAIRRRKHLLIEKPISLEEEEIRKIQEAAAKKGLTVFPGHNFVYRPVVRKAKEILESGELGAISYGSFRAVHFIPPEHAAGWRKSFSNSGGGAMMDSGTHLVYQSLYLLGKPEHLSCFTAKRHYTRMEGEDTCQLTLQYKSGTVGSIYQGWSGADESAGEVRIIGDKGNLLISDALYLNGRKIEDDSSYENSFFHLLQALADSLENGTAPVSTADDALMTLRIIQRGYRAADGKKLFTLHNYVNMPE